jgi:hypothetical protein
MMEINFVFDRKIASRLHSETIEAKSIKRFIKSVLCIQKDRLRANLKLTTYTVLTATIMIYACPASVFAAGICLWKLQRLSKQDSLGDWQLPNAYTDPRFACEFRNSTHVKFRH